MHQVLPSICAAPAALRPLARQALRVLDEQLGASGELSPLALAFRAQIFRALMQRQRLTEVPLMDLGLADAAPSTPGRGQRWGFGRHLAAAVAAMVLTDADQIVDLAPCDLAANLAHAPSLPLLPGCGLGKSEFLELVAVPLCGCVIVLRRSLERLKERPFRSSDSFQEWFGEQRLVAILQKKAPQIFAFALQLPFLTFADQKVTVESVAAAFREVAPQAPGCF